MSQARRPRDCWTGALQVLIGKREYVSQLSFPGGGMWACGCGAPLSELHQEDRRRKWEGTEKGT